MNPGNKEYITNKNNYKEYLTVVNGIYKYYTRYDGTLKYELSDSTVNLGDNSFLLEEFYNLII